MEVKEYLDQYYENYKEDERLLRKYCSVEFLTTVKYIDQYLKKDMRILEVGAATGRYSLHYAEQGYRVDAADLVDYNLNILKSKIKENHNITVHRANALDLSMYQDNTFDITLVLGPLYHLFTEEDQKKAIAEAVRVTKKNGIIYLAYISNDSVILSYGLLSGNLVKDRKSGVIDENFRCTNIPERLFRMNYVHEFKEMMKQFDIEHLHTVASDGMAGFLKDIINEMDEEFYQTWLEYHFSICERQDLIGYSNHVLYICKKN